MFDELMNDKVVVQKQDGVRSGPFNAAVSRDQITMDHNSVLVEAGDLIIRTMSNGAEETFKVLDPCFYEAFHGIPAHYQMRVRNLNALDAQQEMARITYNITGDNNKILHHSTDNSVNVTSDNDRIWELYAKLQEEVLSLPHLSRSESEDSAAALLAIEKQLQEEKPNKRLIRTMIDLLPAAGNVATIASLILGLIA